MTLHSYSRPLQLIKIDKNKNKKTPLCLAFNKQIQILFVLEEDDDKLLIL